MGPWYKEEVHKAAAIIILWILDKKNIITEEADFVFILLLGAYI